MMRSIATTSFALLLAACASLPATGGRGEGPAAHVGQVADFTLPTFDGSQVRLAALKGKVVLVDFWASWCGPCRESMPFYEQLYRSHGPRGLQILAINVEPQEQREAALAFLKEVPFSFPALSDTQGAVVSWFAIEKMPTSLIFDRQGVLRFVHEGFHPGEEQKVTSEIESLL